MKQVLLLFFLFCFTTKSFSQKEFNTKFKAIPPTKFPIKPKKNTPVPADLPKIITPNVFKSPEAQIPSSTFKIGETSTINMIPKNEFINPGDEYMKKLNKKEDFPEGIIYRRNQNLGDFKTKSTSAKILYRDAAYVDGDIIRVYLNDKVIQMQVVLDSNFQGFEIVLDKGFNKIDFEALNQGTSGPNTAEFQVYDDKGALISASQWNLGTGFKATILLTKE
jgi:hypothetical protein